MKQIQSKLVMRFDESVQLCPLVKVCCCCCWCDTYCCSAVLSSAVLTVACGAQDILPILSTVPLGVSH